MTITFSKQEMEIIKQLKATKGLNIPLMNRGIKLCEKILSKYNLDVDDVFPDGVNRCISRFGLLLDLKIAIKTKYDDPEDMAVSPELQDMAMVGRHDFCEYFYLNGYARVETVNVGDILGELEDIEDYINEEE